MKSEIEFIEYAEKQISEREIDKKLIQETLKNPGQIVEGKKGRKIAQKIFKREDREFLLRVVFVEERDLLQVITSYWTSKISKYWRRKDESEV